MTHPRRPGCRSSTPPSDGQHRARLKQPRRSRGAQIRRGAPEQQAEPVDRLAASGVDGPDQAQQIQASTAWPRRGHARGRSASHGLASSQFQRGATMTGQPRQALLRSAGAA